MELLRRAYDAVREAGWSLVNADCVLVGEEPRIAEHRDAMRRRLSEALGGGEVNVRATTTDHLGFTGPRRGARGAGGRPALTVMEIVRYADRPDLRELRRDALNTFPEFMNHNAMGWRYWGRLYDEFPAFQLALVDGGVLVGEVHALRVPLDGDELPAGWDEAFERGMEGGGGNHLSLLAISVDPARRGEGVASRLLDAARRAAGAGGLESVIAPVRPTLKERYPLIPIERYIDVAPRRRHALRPVAPRPRTRAAAGSWRRRRGR